MTGLDSILEEKTLYNVILNEPLTPICVGSETKLDYKQDKLNIKELIGFYVGARYKDSKIEVIKISPINKKLLDAPENLSRYMVIGRSQVKEIYCYEEQKIFP